MSRARALRAAVFSAEGTRLCEAAACGVATPLTPFTKGLRSIALCMVHSIQLANWLDADQRRRFWSYFDGASLLIYGEHPEAPNGR